MKILLIGEYSNVHWTLAEGLRELGHEATVVSNGDFWKNYPRDIDVSRPKGRLGPLLMLKILRLLPKMRNFDVVQLINPMFFELKAERLRFFYHFLRKNNRKIVLGAFGCGMFGNRREKVLPVFEEMINSYVPEDIEVVFAIP